MSPCIELRHKSIDILHNNFSDIWKTIGTMSFEKLKENEYDYKCINCKLLVICRSCPALRERINGSATIVTENDCVVAEELFKVMQGDLKNARK